MLVGLGGVEGGDLAGLLVLDALVDEHRGVAAVVQDHVRAAGGGVRPGQRLLRAPPVLLQRFALPGEDRDALGVLGRTVRADGDGGGRVVLGGEDVAGHPADLGAEGDQGLDQDGGLHGHVQRAHDPGAGQRLGLGELAADGHQAGHLVLGEGDLLAAELGQGEIGDLEVLSVVDSRHGEVLLGVGARWERLVCAAADTGVPGGGHRNARVRAAQSVGGPLSLGRSAVGPPDRHQQRRLAPTQATPVDPAAPSPPPDGSSRTRADVRCRIGFPGELRQGARKRWEERSGRRRPGTSASLSRASDVAGCTEIRSLWSILRDARDGVPRDEGVRRTT